MYVVIRRDRDGAKRLLLSAYTVILISWDDLPVPELVQRYRGKQGQGNAFNGPLTELALHHPSCKSYRANQAFYRCRQSAKLLPPQC